MKGASVLSKRLTIDDAIMHAKKVAEEKYLQGMLCHANPNDSELDKCIECGKEHEQLAKWLEKMKQYLELEEQGLLLRLPCKVGSEVYYILGVPQKTPCVVEKANFGLSDINKIGKTLFLTQSEAEEKLRELEGK